LLRLPLFAFWRLLATQGLVEVDEVDDDDELICNNHIS
jgi:hypothetical protein